MRTTAEHLIERLFLARHPEGGWFRETYRSHEQREDLPSHISRSRCICTAIYFLLEHGEFSALHRIKSDELWHHYAGSGLLIHVIDPGGEYRQLRLGKDIEAGEQFQAVVPAGSWFGAEPKGEGYSLVGCTVAPGFDFADLELADRGRLCVLYPQHRSLIDRLTR